jgi:hypothetical protein
MPEIVEALVRQARIPKDRLEATGHGDPVHRRPDGRGENEAPIINVPSRSGEQTVAPLAEMVATQGRDDECWKGDRAMARQRLRRDQLESAVDPLQSLSHGDDAILRIDVLPSQAQDLTLAQAGPDGQ